jgi:hypothetical protein
MQTLPLGITQEMMDAAKEKHGTAKVFLLEDSEGINYGHVVMGRPTANVISEWEKWLDKNPFKSRQVLINGTLCNRQEELKLWEKNSEQYAALYDAATQMLPVGKATAKNL